MSKAQKVQMIQMGKVPSDATSGKKSYTKTLYTMNLHLHMHLDILKKKWKEMSKNIVLTYSDI